KPAPTRGLTAGRGIRITPLDPVAARPPPISFLTTALPRKANGQYVFGPQGDPQDRASHRGQPQPPQPASHLSPQGRGGDRFRRPEGRQRSAPRRPARDRP